MPCIDDSPLIRPARFFGVLVAVVILAAPLLAQPSTPPPPAAEIGRADLAAAYLRFERAYAAAAPTGDRRVAMHKAFDRASLRFFAQQFADAIREIDAQVADLRSPPGAPPAPAILAALSHRARLAPPVLALSAATPITLTIDRLYATAAEPAAQRPTHAALILRDAGGAEILRRTVALPGDDPRGGVTPIDIDRAALKPGVIDLALSVADAEPVAVGRWLVTARPLDDRRREHERRLAAVAPGDEASERLRAAIESRNALLLDRPEPDSTAAVVLDADAIAADIDAEITAFAAGRNPFSRQPGDHWRTFRVASSDVPMRVYAPPAVAAGTAPAPLVIALHGAGGDENMFMDAYGGGALKRLADARGFIAVAPATLAMSAPSAFAALLDDVRRDYRIDPDRVYVLGHSLGAGVTLALARGNADALAAAACLAGPGRLAVSAERPLPPLLVVAAEFDALIPLERLRDSVDAAIKGAAPGAIEFRTIAGAGHTMMVGEALPETIDWLLQRRRSAPAP